MAQAYELVIPIGDIPSYDACDRNEDHMLLKSYPVDHTLHTRLELTRKNYDQWITSKHVM